MSSIDTEKKEIREAFNKFLIDSDIDDKKRMFLFLAKKDRFAERFWEMTCGLSENGLRFAKQVEGYIFYTCTTMRGYQSINMVDLFILKLASILKEK